MAVGTFREISNVTNSGIKVSVVTVPEQIQYGGFGMEIGVKCLEFYEEFFNISYPLPKVDLMSLTDFAMGAMENWGLITFRYADIIYISQAETGVILVF